MQDYPPDKQNTSRKPFEDMPESNEKNSRADKGRDYKSRLSLSKPIDETDHIKESFKVILFHDASKKSAGGFPPALKNGGSILPMRKPSREKGGESYWPQRYRPLGFRLTPLSP